MEFLKKHKIASSAVVIIIVTIVASFAFRGNGSADFETQIVSLSDVRQFVEETGVVESFQEADLSVEQTGKIASILVSKGGVVSAGDVLVQLDSGEQYANLLSAQAQLKAAEANLADTLANASGSSQSGSNLGTTEEQQQALVENAYAKLLSEGLVAEPSSQSYTQTPPVISGRYVGPEGTYKVIFDRGDQINDYEIRVFDLETVRNVEISKTSPTPLGTRGLFVTLPDPIVDYMNTIWYVDIPNTKSGVYLANYNNYISAKAGADVTITQTGVTAEKIKAQEAQVDQARANVALAEANLNKRTLRAPFDGVISGVDVSVGEIASPGVPAVSMISSNNYEVVVNIPEADIANVSVGDSAEVTFDAYEGEIFSATVVFINPSARIVNGVSTFETVLEFDEDSEKIRSGLSADVNILAEEKSQVIAIPSRAVVENDRGERFVRVVRNGLLEEVIVKTGLRGSNGFIEITEGLKEGDEVVTFISDDALAKWNENRE